MPPAVEIEIVVGADPDPAAFDARRVDEALAELGRRAVGQHRHGRASATPAMAQPRLAERQGATLERAAGTCERVRPAGRADDENRADRAGCRAANCSATMPP